MYFWLLLISLSAPLTPKITPVSLFLTASILFFSFDVVSVIHTWDPWRWQEKQLITSIQSACCVEKRELLTFRPGSPEFTVSCRQFDTHIIMYRKTRLLWFPLDHFYSLSLSLFFLLPVFGLVCFDSLSEGIIEVVWILSLSLLKKIRQKEWERQRWRERQLHSLRISNSLVSKAQNYGVNVLFLSKSFYSFFLPSSSSYSFDFVPCILSSFFLLICLILEPLIDRFPSSFTRDSRQEKGMSEVIQDLDAASTGVTKDSGSQHDFPSFFESLDWVPRASSSSRVRRQQQRQRLWWSSSKYFFLFPF